MANKPLPIASASILPNCLIALAITCNAAPNTIKPLDVLDKPLESPFSNLTAANMTPSDAVIPNIPFTISCGPKSDNTFKAVDSNSTDAPIPINTPAIPLNNPNPLPFISAKDIAVNSASNTVIPPNAGSNLLLSIDAIITIAPANIAIAPAILISLSVCKSS